jgi:hypothetical protein
MNVVHLHHLKMATVLFTDSGKNLPFEMREGKGGGRGKDGGGKGKGEGGERERGRG